MVCYGRYGQRQGYALYLLVVAGWLTEKFGRKTMMLVSAAIAALACLPICLTDGSYALRM